MRAAAAFVCAMALGGCTAASGVQRTALDSAIAAAPAAGGYRLSGARELRPIRIDDDGLRTFIVWSQEQDLPAVFAVNAVGAEEMVNGYMRDGVFTIDRIYARLVFRIDRKVTRADRTVDRTSQ